MHKRYVSHQDTTEKSSLSTFAMAIDKNSPNTNSSGKQRITASLEQKRRRRKTTRIKCTAVQVSQATKIYKRNNNQEPRHIIQCRRNPPCYSNETDEWSGMKNVKTAQTFQPSCCKNPLQQCLVQLGLVTTLQKTTCVEKLPRSQQLAQEASKKQKAPKRFREAFKMVAFERSNEKKYDS